MTVSGWLSAADAIFGRRWKVGGCHPPWLFFISRCQPTAAYQAVVYHAVRRIEFRRQRAFIFVQSGLHRRRSVLIDGFSFGQANVR